MQLLASLTSPYARKCRALAIECGLDDQVELVVTNPWDDPAALNAANSLGKVPCLITDDGRAIYDSPVICEYLIAQTNAETQARLLPTGDARWPVLRAQALADGILDLGVAHLLENRRPDGERSPGAMARWERQMLAGLDAMPAELDALPGNANLGHLACAVTLLWLDFRHAPLAWRDGRADLASWVDGFASRASLAATPPPAA